MSSGTKLIAARMMRVKKSAVGLAMSTPTRVAMIALIIMAGFIVSAGKVAFILLAQRQRSGSAYRGRTSDCGLRVEITLIISTRSG